ncbi:MAG: phosphatidylglycerol lysyltransferase domain-containing protein, partial [Planctomycetota bacterium]
MSTNGFESEPHAGHRQVVAAVPAVRPPLDDDLTQRMQLLRQYGNFTLAYSAARQPGLQHFTTPQGFIAFERLWGINFVLGDPVVAEQHKADLLRQYLRTYPKSTFVQVSRGTAEMLASERFFINEMGLDFELDLANYDFAGKKKERLRYSGNRLRKRGYTIRELSVDEAGGPKRLRAITESWRSALAVSGHPEEIRFLNRPPVYQDEPDVRKFFVFDAANELVGFY